MPKVEAVPATNPNKVRAAAVSKHFSELEEQARRWQDGLLREHQAARRSFSESVKVPKRDNGSLRALIVNKKSWKEAKH